MTARRDSSAAASHALLAERESGAFALGHALAWVALGLEVVHAVTLFTLTHPLFASNSIQVLLPLVAVAGCLARSAQSGESRRNWQMLCAGYTIWTIAEIVYLYNLAIHPRVSAFFRVDDILWMFFAVPFFLVLSGCLEGKLSRISLLDQAQVLTSFLVVAFLVFSRSASLSFNQAYDVQNLALLLSCAARYSMAESRRERALFRDLGIYLLVYFVCAAAGNALADHGWLPGSPVDLFWSAPIALFCWMNFHPRSLALSCAQAGPQKTKPPSWARHAHDLSALGLAGLSMAASAYLVLSVPVLGYLFLALSFLLLAMRTSRRSSQLHLANDSLHQSVLTDPLTGLGNRACLRLSLERLSGDSAAGRLSPFLMFIDLDRFKAINDGLGHEAGDHILMEVGKRIQDALESQAIACRLGGDEFVVLLRVPHEQEGRQTAARVLERIRAPLLLAGKPVQLSASIGLVFGTNLDSPDDLLRRADQAMYEAKRLGKNRVHGFSSALDEKRSSFLLETELRKCLEDRELQAYLQPIFCLSNGHLSGFEALARWTHAELGAIPPSTFVPLAEGNGTILELGRQMITGALTAVASWNRTENVPAWVSVNVSAVQLSDPGFLPFVLESLGSTGIDPCMLHLEITESVMLSDDRDRISVLSEAQRHGIHVSLDDFGTGYSSLSYLLNFPTDEIKIDRGFIRGMDKDVRRRELVRTVLHLGASLKKRVIAEGVETKQELDLLKSMGCEYVQGYLLGKPLPVDILRTLSGQSLRFPALILHGEPDSSDFLIQ